MRSHLISNINCQMDQTDKQYLDLIASLTSYMGDFAQIYQTHKQQLTLLMINKDSNDDEKLEQLEDNILHYRANPHPEINSDKMSEIFGNGQIFENLDFITRTKRLTQLIALMIEPGKTHNDLLETIATILKNEKTNTLKVKEIRRLLL